MNKQLSEISKFLSFVLRHQPEAIGVTLDAEGWADIELLIACANQSCQALTRPLLEEVVETSDKKRFTISEDGLCIRAAQGHSKQSVAITHVEKIPPEFLYHGTATRFLESILKEGLKPGSRHYVHLSEDEQTATAVGQRYGKPVVLKIEALRMQQQGFKFFQAENGVWLVKEVSAKQLSSTNQFLI
ncbi:putative RNA 2'-phosphotransferase [Betaproteobacteria bacterium]|nr:putative RNA 2'-phosphotransferase [Betaproteobacteria bacterium]GHU20194.1 putative RNA 2'-phosphotransferase [Betaproteobacteria bacterium]